jgi:hypothetical protein
MAKLTEFLKSLLSSPEELAELRTALQALPAPAPPARPEMDPQERTAEGNEQARQRKQFEQGADERKAALAAAEARRLELDREIASLGAEQATAAHSYCVARDASMTSLDRKVQNGGDRPRGRDHLGEAGDGDPGPSRLEPASGSGRDPGRRRPGP